jgi:DNA-directed RNA polymerase specialized sigma24 family protein
MPFTAEEIATAYDELREVARRMAARAPVTLAGTAGVHEVLAKVLQGGPREWNDRAHFVGWCVQALQHAWVDHVRQRRRHHGVDALRASSALCGEEPVGDVETLVSAVELLQDLAKDETVEARDELARAVVCRHVLEMSEAETADALGLSLATMKRRQAAFREWARRRAAPHREDVAALAARVSGDPALRHGARIGAVAQAVLVEHRAVADVAAAEGRTPADVRRDLDFFRAWAAAQPGAR